MRRPPNLARVFRLCIEDAEEKRTFTEDDNCNKVMKFFDNYYFTFSELKRLVELAEEAENGP